MLVCIVAGIAASGCVTSRVEDARESSTGINEGEAVVVMAKSYHLGNETEEKYIRCVEKALGNGSGGLRVIPHRDFVDSLFPWFEPRTAPAETKHLPKLMGYPGVVERIEEQKVRYIIWLDGDTERVAGGGSLSCAAGPGGGGCFGFAWWQNDADYQASVWDLEELESAGNCDHRCQRYIILAGTRYPDSANRAHPIEGLQITGRSTATIHQQRRRLRLTR